MNKRNIVFVADKNYLRHLSVALASLLDNNSGMKVHVINNDIPDADIKKMRKIFAGKDSTLIDAKTKGCQVESLITPDYFTSVTYYKLFIPDIVEGDKALYLDPDIVVTQDIDDLYNTDISDVALAAVNDTGRTYEEIHYNLGMKSSAKYFNSGVMLINLEHWRLTNIKEKTIEFIEQNSEAIRFADQDGLNAVINGSWLELHPKYNLHTGLFYVGDSIDSRIPEAINNPVIIHYTGSSKPSDFKNSHMYKHLYWKYLRMTPYKYFIPDDLTIYNILKWIAPKPLKEFVKKALRKYFFASLSI